MNPARISRWGARTRGCRGAPTDRAAPRNSGDNLTLVGAMHGDRWLSLATLWGAFNTPRFVAWVGRCLVRHLRPGDILLLDNLGPHKARRVRALIEAAGATLRFLPALLVRLQSDQAAWASIKKRIRAVAPRTAVRAAVHGPARQARGAAPSLSKLVCPCWLPTQVIDGLKSRELQSLEMVPTPDDQLVACGGSLGVDSDCTGRGSR